MFYEVELTVSVQCSLLLLVYQFIATRFVMNHKQLCENQVAQKTKPAE